MSGLALVAHVLGAQVSGSDRAESSYIARLREGGLEPAVGHDAANVPEGAEVVVSTAISEHNAELALARERGQPVLHRGRLLAEAAALKRSIGVSGTHGKTTTSSMAAHVLIETGRDPAYLIGGELRSTRANAGWGDGEWMVVEADESDRSFLELAPDVAVVTNLELDHHATYRSLAQLETAFRRWLEPAPRRLVWERLRLTGVEAVETFGIEEGGLAAHEVRLDPGGSSFMVDGVEVRLRVPGAHNVLNALAALGACRAAGVEPPEAGPALASFTGAGRRFELVGTAHSGAAVYDDYAHHPTEVRATLEAARTLEPRRLVACFQPHLYSRTALLRREFGRALSVADVVLVLDVYPARERTEDHPGVSGWLVATATADAAAGRPVYWTPGQDDAERLLAEELRDGDVLLTLGAGDVDRLAHRLVRAS
jgi:UDP-N-acetylmuramate--alanine ligase